MVFTWADGPDLPKLLLGLGGVFVLFSLGWYGTIGLAACLFCLAAALLPWLVLMPGSRVTGNVKGAPCTPAVAECWPDEMPRFIFGSAVGLLFFGTAGLLVGGLMTPFSLWQVGTSAALGCTSYLTAFSVLRCTARG